MGIQIANNFTLKAKKYLDERQNFKTIAEMVAYAETSLPDGFICYNVEDGKRYEFNSSNSVDVTLGKWREYSATGSGSTTKEIIPNNPIGSIVKGTPIPKNTSLETIITNMLVKYIPATVVMSISPVKTLYKVGESVSTLDITATVTKESESISYIKYYVGSSEVDNKTETTDTGLSNGGSYTYQYTTPITTDSTIKVEVNDGKSNVEKTIDIKFVNPVLVGSTADCTTELVQEQGNITYDNFNIDNDQIVIKYDSSWGELTSIIDKNQFEYIQDFTKTTEVIGSVTYNVYTLNDPITLDNYSMTFIF